MNLDLCKLGSENGASVVEESNAINRIDTAIISSSNVETEPAETSEP